MIVLDLGLTEREVDDDLVVVSQGNLDSRVYALVVYVSPRPPRCDVRWTLGLTYVFFLP